MNRIVNGKLAAGLVALAAALALVAATSAVGPEDADRKPPKIGEKAPNFTLTDLEDNKHELQTYLDEGKTVVLEWFNPGCPWVQRAHSAKVMSSTFERFKDDDVVWLAINSGGEGQQGHGVEVNAKAKEKWELEYPILLDAEGKVGKAYGAKTTPHMYVISADGLLIYKGAIDERKDEPGETNHIAAALTQHLAGETIEVDQTKPYGCSVHYAR